jgi:hypothetical protein
MRTLPGASHFTADRQALRQTYLPLLRQMITTPLVSKDKDGIDEVMAIMNAYGFSREDWDSVQVPQQFVPIHINSHKCIQIHINLYKFISIHINSYQFISIHIDCRKCFNNINSIHS